MEQPANRRIHASEGARGYKEQFVGKPGTRTAQNTRTVTIK